MRTLYKLSSILLTTLLSACVLQSSQLNGLLDLIKEPEVDLAMSSWEVRYNGYQSVVYAVSTSEGILFSNSAGDQVLFDGWTIREVVRMGQHQSSLSIDDVSNNRFFKRRNKIVSSHSCDQWRMRNNLGLTSYSQACRARQAYKNSILIKNNGDISVIRQIVDERYTPLMLTKLH